MDELIGRLKELAGKVPQGPVYNDMQFVRLQQSGDIVQCLPRSKVPGRWSEACCLAEYIALCLTHKDAIIAALERLAELEGQTVGIPLIELDKGGRFP